MFNDDTQNNGFLASVSSAKPDNKEQGSDFTHMFQSPIGSDVDPELYNLLKKQESPAQKRIKVISGEDAVKKAEKRTKFQFKVEIFRIFNPSDLFRYETLMNDIWNNTDNFINVREQKNWDKSGTLTVVVEYVEIVELPPLDDEAPAKITKKRDKAHTKVQKPGKGMQDSVMPTNEDSMEGFVEDEYPGNSALSIPRELTQFEGDNDE